MCGIFAGIGKLSSNRMIALGSMNEERGTDSVGLAYLQGNDMRIAKVAERPCVGLNITLRKAVTEAAVSGMFIGHTRQATQGSVTARNAHPFLDSGIAFAHNGIILNDDEFGKYEVDSESLIHGIKERNFSKYEGPIALVWIQDGKLHAYRCGNPLYRGRHNGSTYLASEGDYLKAIGCTHVKSLAEGMIYTFDSPEGIRTEKVQKNQTYTSKYLSSGSGYHNDYMSSTTSTLEAYLSRHAERTNREVIDLPLLQDQEDFRTSKDLSKDMIVKGETDRCECCGTLAELNDKGMCLDCLTWLDDQGVTGDKDIPSWMRVL